MTLVITDDVTIPKPDGPEFLGEYHDHLVALYNMGCRPLSAVGAHTNVVAATSVVDFTTSGIVDGTKFSIIWNGTNTAGVTLAVNGGTAIDVLDSSGVALVAGSIVAGLMSIIEYRAGDYRILTPILAGSSVAVASRYYLKATVTQTWNKPTGYDDDSILWVELWGGGGSGRSGGTNANGGGGGGYVKAGFRLGDLPASLTLTIGTGGAAATGANGNGGADTSFGTLLVAEGGQGGPNTTVGGVGGGFSIGANDLHQPQGELGGQGGACANVSTAPQAGFDSEYGGGGGGSGNGTTGGANVPRGASVFGGDGGTGGDSSPVPTAGAAPGGAGGASQSSGTPSGAGARGEARLYI